MAELVETSEAAA